MRRQLQTGFKRSRKENSNGQHGKNMLEKAGGTPLVEISNKLNKGGAKVEFFDPGGSVKDYIAFAMVAGERYLSTWLYE